MTKKRTFHFEDKTDVTIKPQDPLTIKRAEKDDSHLSPREKARAKQKELDDQIMPLEREQAEIRLQKGILGQKKLRGEYVDAIQVKENTKAEPVDRMLAMGIDYFIFLVIYSSGDSITQLIIPFLTISPETVTELGLYGKYGVLLCGFIFYNTFFPYLFHRTIGMMLFKQHVLSVNEDPIGVMQLWIRELIAKPICIFSGVGLLLLFQKSHRGLCDLMMRTVVITDKK